MLGKNGFIILMVCLTLIMNGGIVYYSIQNNKVCDELVIMNDGSQIDGTEIYSEENGMTTIRQCNGEEIRIPTINIKMVKHIEK